MTDETTRHEVEDTRRARAPRAAATPSLTETGVAQEEEVSLLNLVTLVLRYRRVIALAALVVAFGAGVLALRAPRTYTTNASFIPQGAEQSGGGAAAALAGRFGISLQSGAPGESPAFYASLLESREVLAGLLTDPFLVEVAGSEGEASRTVERTLFELLETENVPPAQRRTQAIRWLQGVVSTRIGQQTGLVELELTTRWPEVSKQIGERLLARLNEFNLEQRRGQAMAERAFIEERLEAARAELLEAENRLKQFLERNRTFQSSPELTVEYERLQRQVGMRQQIVTSLGQAFEEARIAEFRNTPVITVVEHPELPVRPDARGLAFNVVLGGILGLSLGVLVAFWREMIVRRREKGDEDYREFRNSWDDTLDEVKRPLRWLVGKVRSQPEQGSR